MRLGAALLLVLCSRQREEALGVQPRAAGSPQPRIHKGSQVALVGDVQPWSGSLRPGEFGVVEGVMDGEEPGEGTRYLVKRADGSAVWHEEDEIIAASGGVSYRQDPGPARPAPAQRASGGACEMAMFYPSHVKASSAAASAAALADRAPAAPMHTCTDGEAPLAIQPWLPDRDTGRQAWLEAQLPVRLHVKDVTVYKRGPSGLVRRMEGFEPTWDGHKMRELWAGQDTTGCGTLLASLPSLPPWSIEKLRLSFHLPSNWKAAQAGDPVGAGAGIASIEVLGLDDACYADFIGEDEKATKLRKRMENGFTGCSFSGVSSGEAALRSHDVEQRAATIKTVDIRGEGSCGAPAQ